MKYQLPKNESTILPNLLGLTSAKDIALAEFEGFLKAEILLSENLSKRTKFSVSYIRKIHTLSLGHLYSFAGEFRNVNLSKGGFPFAAAKFLPETMKEFDKEILSTLPHSYKNKENLINDIAVVHAELLVIHPFREGNGRTARVLANLMSRKQGYGYLRFELLEKKFDTYVLAVQKSVGKDYTLMIELVESIFAK